MAHADSANDPRESSRNGLEVPGSDAPSFGNWLLACLPPEVAASLATHWTPVRLERGEVLFRAHEPLRFVYFPSTSVVSLETTLESGESLEVGLVGRDGLAGTAVLPGMSMMSCDAVVQIPGMAYRLTADELRGEISASDTLSSWISRYSQVLFARSMKLTVCNTFHTAEQRCIRWLLTISDLTAQDDLPLTHDLVATMLGLHRPTVTLAVRLLHNAGVLAERRGHIVIVDRGHLERACCECYRVVKDEQRRLVGY